MPDHVTGTLIWHYFVCKGEVWLMAHEVNPREDCILFHVMRTDRYAQQEILGKHKGNPLSTMT